MKNKILLAVLAIALVFGMTACGGGGGGGGSTTEKEKPVTGGNFQIKVVNENDKPITKVESLAIVWSVDCNITKGNSQTFPVDRVAFAGDMGVWYGDPSTKASNHIYTDNGKTTTITLTAGGKLTSDKKGGFYTE